MPAVVSADAARKADEIAEQVRAAGLDPAYAELERALQGFTAAGYPLESILPADARAVGFSLRRASDGKSFWEVYATTIRAELCKPDGELHSLTKAGLSGSASAILTALVSGLGLPVAAVGIAIPIAGILAAKGVDAFCEFSRD
jgi:hypothetical protein